MKNTSIKKDYAMIASKNVFGLLKKRGYRQVDLAIALGLSEKQVGRYKHDGIINVYTIDDCATFLGVSFSDLLVSDDEEVIFVFSTNLGILNQTYRSSFVITN